MEVSKTENWRLEQCVSLCSHSNFRIHILVLVKKDHADGCHTGDFHFKCLF
jgi:hypothetical protein